MIKCEMTQMIEQLDKDNFCTSESTDNGVVQTIEAANMDELHAKLRDHFNESFLNKLEVFDERLEAMIEEHNDDGTKYLSTYALYISEVVHNSINPNIALDFIKSNRS